MLPWLAQMVVHGDPTRRATDHSESYGASIKDALHRRCLRRRLETAGRVHKSKRRKDANGKPITWKQGPLRVSRVMQVHRDVSVQTQLLWEEASAPYLQRKHRRVAMTGFATAGRPCEPCEAKPAPESIFIKIQEGLEYA
jgi:hypothetical protein